MQAVIMATVNFSVPDEIKDAFNREFSGRCRAGSPDTRACPSGSCTARGIGRADSQQPRDAGARLYLGC